MSESASNHPKTVLNHIKNCINNYFVLSNTKDSLLEIREPKNTQILTIEDAYHNTSLCISLDKDRVKGEFDKAFPFLNPEHKGLTKKSDAIVFHYRDEILYIIIIELKNKKTDYKQIKSSFLFSEYLLKLIQLHNQAADNLFSQKIQFIGLFALQQKSLPKDLTIDPNHTAFPVFLYSEPTLKISRLIQHLKRNPTFLQTNLCENAS